MQKTKILSFFSPTCGPCRLFTPTITEAISETSFDFERIDITKGSPWLNKFEIRAVPTTIMIKNGEEVDRLTGNHAINDVREWLKAHA